MFFLEERISSKFDKSIEVIEKYIGFDGVSVVVQTNEYGVCSPLKMIPEMTIKKFIKVNGKK